MKQAIENHFQGRYQEFYLKYLPKTKKIGGDEYQALCPFHDDKTPSFNFNGQTGKYFCHGCGKRGHALHFYGKIHDLDTKRDFLKILKGIAKDFGIPWEEQKKRIVQTYDYTDEEGNLVYQVCRMEPKDFRQRQPDGNGGWIWNLKGIDPILYNLPAVMKAKEILVNEGEKDVRTADKMGFVATTCPMGAGKWRGSYNPPLKGKDVVLIPDNDEEGRKRLIGWARFPILEQQPSDCP
jgi:DNA primase